MLRSFNLKQFYFHLAAGFQHTNKKSVLSPGTALVKCSRHRTFTQCAAPPAEISANTGCCVLINADCKQNPQLFPPLQRRNYKYDSYLNSTNRSELEILIPNTQSVVLIYSSVNITSNINMTN